MTFYVVYLDSNPLNVAGFFSSQGAAIAWRDDNFPGADVREARLTGYTLVTTQAVTF
jgi:hypothetical protein